MNQTKYNLDQRLSYLTNRVSFAINELFLVDLQRHNLTIPMWRVLVTLHDRGDMKLVDLAEQTTIEGSTLSRLTEAMRKRRLIGKARSKRSKREITITLADAGDSVVRQLIPKAQELEAVMLAAIPANDIDVTRRSLYLMYNHLAGAIAGAESSAEVEQAEEEGWESRT